MAWWGGEGRKEWREVVGRRGWEGVEGGSGGRWWEGESGRIVEVSGGEERMGG